MKRAVVVALVALAPFCACRRSPTGSGAPTTSASVSSLTSASAAPSTSTSGGAGLVANNCLSCHSQDMLAQQRLTAAQWAKVVTKMHGWGAPMEDQKEIDAVAAHLASLYGPDAGPYTMPVMLAEHAEAALAPLPDGAFASGDAEKGAALYKELCATCHGANAQGDKLGVNLVDRPLLYRAPEFAERSRIGRGKMPAFPTLTDPQIASLLAHLRKQRSS